MTHDALLTTPIDALDQRYAELRIAQPRAEAAMATSMGRFGQISPVVAARDSGDDAPLVLVDGFKRLAAARGLGFETLSVRTMPLSARASVAAVYSLNRGGRGLMDLEEALVVRKLVRELGLTQPEVGELLERHKSWVSRRLSLVERLCDEVQDDVRVGLIVPTVAREVARLPRGNQPEVAATVQQHGLTSREASVLVSLFEAITDRRARTFWGIEISRSAWHVCDSRSPSVPTYRGARSCSGTICRTICSSRPDCGGSSSRGRSSSSWWGRISRLGRGIFGCDERARPPNSAGLFASKGRGALIAPGTVPAKPRACCQSRPTAVLRSAPTRAAIPERIRRLGAT